jgi:hypothetical protein
MHVNLPPSAKTENHPAIKPAPSLAGKAPAVNFGELLKNAQASAGATPQAAQVLTPVAPDLAK